MAAKRVKKGRVLVGLSGGVDSAVSAYLLIKAGYEVEGVFMKNWSSTTGLKLAECPWLADRQESLRVAAFLGIPLHTVDFEKQYQATVMKYFFTEYGAGRTPNPDVMCNKEIKFKLLYEWAMKRGFDFLATGHYAQIGATSNKQQATRKGKSVSSLSLVPGPLSLLRSVDEFKDQTYFIYNIRAEQLPHLLFPIGGMKKAAVKKLAAKIGLPNAARKESMGLCFVGKVRLKEFLEQKVKPKPGPIKLIESGETIGTHQSLYTYTIGQRQGIHIGGPGGPYYVVGKDLKKNILYVTSDPNDSRLEVAEVSVHSVNWITKPEVKKGFPISLLARYRHQGELVACTVERVGKDEYAVKFAKPQKALASGQSVVFYNKKTCLCGGVIV